MFGGAGAGAGPYIPSGVSGGFGAPLAIGSAEPRNFISRTLGFAERPSAIIVRSDDAAFLVGATDVVQPSRFDVVLKQPVLDIKAMALRSVTLRNLVPNVPSYQRFFYYTVNNRRFVFRYGAYSVGSVLEITRELTDFVQYLNQSAQWLVEVPPGFLVTDDWYKSTATQLNPADTLYDYVLTFAADSTTGRIGASLDPLRGLPGDVVQIGGLNIVPTIFAPTAYVRRDLFLNTLLGVPAVPDPPITFLRSEGAYTFPEPADLDGTQSFYVTINITSSGTTTAANATRSLLGYFSPGNVPKGNIISYNAPFPHWIWQVAPAVQELVITLLDENLQPFDLPFNCLVELEIVLLYSDSHL